MSSLAALIDELPPHVHRRRRQVTIENESEDAEAARLRWLEDLDAESELRGDMLPAQRAARRLSGEDLERAILADLLHELNRTVRRENGADDHILTGWGGGGRAADQEKMPPVSAVTGPAPATNIGLRATLRSYLDASEPYDRYDALIRHAATALLLAEAVADGRA